MALVLPAQKYVDAIHGPVTAISRQVDIYEEDAVTPWRLNVPIKDGSISADQTRNERRTFSLNISNIDDTYHVAPGELWYDKVVKIFRGAYASDGTVWKGQVGEFLIDKADATRDSLIAMSGRDYTKKLLLSKFVADTNFTAPIPVENLIQDIASNGGIVKFNLPLTGKNTGKDFYFQRGTDRWTAISQIATDYNLELFFSADGYLTLREFADPLTAEIDYTFLTGANGNISNYTKSISDTELYNHVVVVGESSDADIPPVWAEATNTTAGSPTSIAEIGDRVYQYSSSFITTQQQAQDVADQFLKVHALEQFDCNIDAIVVPYLDPGIIVEFLDPKPAAGDPTRYLLSSFTIPLTLSAMSANVKRITIVG